MTRSPPIVLHEKPNNNKIRAQGSAPESHFSWRMSMRKHRKTIDIVAITILISQITSTLALGADCRDCHVPPNLASGAKDLSEIYGTPQRHHPVGINTSFSDLNLNRPTGHTSDFSFYDVNNNGTPDIDEIRFYGSGLDTVECASCHREHGETPPSTEEDAKGYLRMGNATSALCTSCHQL